MIQVLKKTGFVQTLVDNLNTTYTVDVTETKKVPWCSVLEKINVEDSSGTTQCA